MGPAWECPPERLASGRIIYRCNYGMDLTEAERRHRWYHMPSAFRAFDDATLATLVQVCAAALMAFAEVDWDAQAMTPEERR